MPLATGTRLGHYEIRSLLGSGGMGEVYLAHDTNLRPPVALKLLLSESGLSREKLLRFEQEARAVSALNHPNILTMKTFRGSSPIRCGNHCMTTHASRS
jgi:serine/threonine protein kinase